MKFLFKIFYIILYFIFAENISSKELYPFHENFLWGFIDKDGNRIIEPMYLSFGNQSEGLINVRENGKYGYIDTTGNLIIPYIFDFADPFHNGIARVYQGNNPFLINKDGEKLTSISFKNIIDYNNPNFIIFETITQKIGVSTLDNKLIFDTTYTGNYSISPLSDGRSVINKFNNDSENLKDQYGVIDSLGNHIVPFGRFNLITDFKDGFAIVSIASDSNLRILNTLIDKNGRILFTLPPDHSIIEYGLRSDNLFRVLIYKTDLYYEGLVDSKGKFLINNPEYGKILNFHNGRSFAKSNDGYTYLINENGKKINDVPYETVLLNYTGKRDFLEKPFYENTAIVKLNGNWSMIDINGNSLLNFENIEGNIFARRKNLVFYSSDYKEFGFFNLDDQSIFSKEKIIFHTDSYEGFIIKFSKDGVMGYMDLKGNIIWKETKYNNIFSILNIDFKRSASYSIRARSFGFLSGGDNHTVDSSTKKILGYEGFEKNKFGIKIGDVSKSKLQNKFIGRDVFIYNSTKDTIFFNVDGSFLTMNLQAVSEINEWEDIEWQMQGWCGNSYRMLYLMPNSYWRVIIPEYDGSFDTKLRVKLNYKITQYGSDDKEIYSDQFSGCINPAQFWRSASVFDQGYEKYFLSAY